MLETFINRFLNNIRGFLRTDLGRSLFLALAWQLAMFIFATIAMHTFGGIQNHSMPNLNTSALSYTLNWDGQWYQNITNGAYFEADSPSPAFFPLFPLIALALHALSFGLVALPVIGLIINTTFLTLAILYLKRISNILIPKVNPWVAPVLLILSPPAIFMHMFYTESVLCALVISAYYFALKRRWLLCSLLLMIATSTKLAAILFVGLCVLEYIKSHEWNLRSSLKDPRWLTFLIAPLGLMSYSVFLLIARHDPLSMFHSISAWSYHKFNPNVFETIGSSVAHVINTILTPEKFDSITLVNFVLPLSSLAILLGASAYAFLKLKNTPLSILGVVSFIFFTLNSNVVSVHRYILPVFLIYIVGAHAASQGSRLLKWSTFVLVYGGVVTQTMLLVLFATYNFAG